MIRARASGNEITLRQSMYTGLARPEVKMYGFSGRQWIASISSSRRAVSSASGGRPDRGKFAFPFNGLGLPCEGRPLADLVFFFVAMPPFPRAACDKMTGCV